MSGLPSGQGVFSTVKNMAATALAVGHTRLELIGNELEVARITAMRQVMLTQALMFCVGLAVVLTVAWLALVFWDHRVIVVAVAGAGVWAIALYFFLTLRRIGNKAEPLFAASLAELQEDLRQLRAVSGHERPAG